MKEKKILGCTIGELKKWIEEFNISDDTVIVMQRVEDSYFNKEGSTWKEKLIRKEGYWCDYFRRHNKKLAEGHFHDKEQFPNLEPDSWVFREYSEKEIDNCKSEYYACQSPVYYDNEYLYLDGHI